MPINYSDSFSVDDVLEYVETHPQGSLQNPRYFFVGGTAVRLHQECSPLLSSTLRPISDFDIMSTQEESSSVDVFAISDDPSFNWYSGIPPCMVSSLIYNETPILVSSPTLTIGTKLLMTDAPRKKDYEDFLRLEPLVDSEELSEVFRHASHLTSPDVARSVYEKMLTRNNVVQENYFRCLREASNILSKHPEALPAIDYTLQDSQMDSTMINRVVLYHMNNLFDEIACSPHAERIAFEYAEFCRGQDPITLDRLFSNHLRPTIKNRLAELESKNH